MATETERKFLVKGEFRHLAIREIKILQSYLTIDPAKTIRLRFADAEAFLTIKSKIPGKSISKNEWEFPIPASDAREIMNICLPGKIIKTRYISPFAGRTWEVDEFHEKNEGLIIAELELGSENDEFVKPSWVGDEVTGNPAYYNANLIK
jgi:adenylate cyclase